VKDGKDRFLFEMATGTGKTLIAAAVIKLFLRTGNASRVLFLVDRLELEEQARENFVAYLKNDFTAVVYKENRDDWRKAEVVVSTVQSLLFNNKYQQLFSPTDFDLVISDEAHRSIGGNARAVFDYFIGYKLGLTATPRDFLKNFDQATPTTRDPRELERRLLRVGLVLTWGRAIRRGSPPGTAPAPDGGLRPGGVPWQSACGP
jgi:type I restriction enzyme R subunit